MFSIGVLSSYNYFGSLSSLNLLYIAFNSSHTALYMLHIADYLLHTTAQPVIYIIRCISGYGE